MALHGTGGVGIGVVQGLLPVPAQATPPGVSVSSGTGTSPRYALEDHTHASRVQRAALTLDASGQGVWTFVKPFTMKPIVHYMVDKPANDTGGPVIVECIGYTTVVTNGVTTWTAMTVQGYRSMRALPSLTALSLSSLLAGVITGVNSIVAVFGGLLLQSPSGAAGLVVNLAAGEPTPVQ